MNEQHRKAIDAARAGLEGISMALYEIKGEEEKTLGNLPQVLQESKRAEDTIETIDNLEDAINSIEDAIEHLNEAIQ